jgi:hypothetical protein
MKNTIFDVLEELHETVGEEVSSQYASSKVKSWNNNRSVAAVT